MGLFGTGIIRAELHHLLPPPPLLLCQLTFANLGEESRTALSAVSRGRHQEGLRKAPLPSRQPEVSRAVVSPDGWR